MVALTMAGAACASTSGKQPKAESPPIKQSKTLGATHGPNGEKLRR